MRILLTYVTIGRGGDAVQWLALAEGFRREGHTVTIAGASTVRPYSTGTTAARLRGFARSLPWWARDAVEFALSAVTIWRVWRAARRHGADLIVHRATTYDVTGVALARLLRVPLVVHLDAHVPVERRYRSESYWRWLHERMMTLLGRHAALVVTPSRPVRHYCREIGIPPGKLLVQRNGIFARHVRLGLEATRTSPPFARRPVCVLGFVGSLSDWHRVDLLLDALARLVATSGKTSYRLMIVGTGREEARLRGQTERLGIAHLVEWRGPLAHERAVMAMAEFDIAILPSTLATGAPMKLSEYAAMGRPIVAPALPNIRDLLAPETEAVLVEPGSADALAEAIAALAADPERSRQIGRAAQARVMGCTWEATARLMARAASAKVGDTAGLDDLDSVATEADAGDSMVPPVTAQESGQRQ
ncbi:MAG: glycosyltransferase family 4 protein [Acidobacteria bacterium]|nr:glycosyltransferase family 4 protein [Acidobacteriota bacterium]